MARLLKKRTIQSKIHGFGPRIYFFRGSGKKNPIINPKHYIAALWDPIDGEVDPSGVTYAFAKAAKLHGGKYYTNTVVTGRVCNEQLVVCYTAEINSTVSRAKNVQIEGSSEVGFTG